MLAQDIIDKYISIPVQAPTRTSYIPCFSWKTLPISQLQAFETVVRQFSPFGILFEDAIALRPSNPRFILPHCPVTLMPKGRCKGFKVHLKDAVNAIDIGLMGSKSITVTALDAKGYCIATAQTEAIAPSTVKRVYPEQFVQITAKNAKVLRIEAKAPFMMTHFASEVTTPSLESIAQSVKI